MQFFVVTYPCRLRFTFRPQRVLDHHRLLRLLTGRRRGEARRLRLGPCKACWHWDHFPTDFGNVFFYAMHDSWYSFIHIDGIFLKSHTVKLISWSMSLWQFHVPRWHVVVAVEVGIDVVGFQAPANRGRIPVQSGWPPGMYNSIATPKTPPKILNFNQSSLLHILLGPRSQKVAKMPRILGSSPSPALRFFFSLDRRSGDASGWHLDKSQDTWCVDLSKQLIDHHSHCFIAWCF